MFLKEIHTFQQETVPAAAVKKKNPDPTQALRAPLTGIVQNKKSRRIYFEFQFI